MDISKYYQEICKTPIVTKEEETILMAKFFDDSTTEVEKSKIRDRMINANLRCVFNMARKYSRSAPDTFPELIAAGNIGLITGFDKYKPGRGTRVLSYAHSWIFQAIMSEMSGFRIVALPVYRQQIASKIQKKIDRNEMVSLTELKTDFEGTGVSDKDIEDLYKTRYLTFYINDMDESNFEINPIEEGVQKLLDDEKCVAMVNKLPSPYREVVARCFGLADGKEQSVAKISRDLKLNKEDIQEYKEEGLRLLRDLFDV